MNFLETITALENDVLVNIANIEYIFIKINSANSYAIHIKGKEKHEWVEHFTNEYAARKRYEMIKEIVGAK